MAPSPEDSFTSKLLLFLNSSLGLLLVGFLLTGVLGTYLSNIYQEAAWKKEKKHEILRHELEQTQIILDEATILLRSRFYDSQRLLWELDNSDKNIFEAVLKNYRVSKDKWNINIYIYRNKIIHLLDEELAYTLLDPKNKTKDSESSCIHDKFVTVNEYINELIKCKKNTCNNVEELRLKAEAALNGAGLEIDYFIDKSYSKFKEKYKITKMKLAN